ASNNVNTYYQLSQSEKNYNEAKNNLENGLNTELNSAEAAFKSAENELKNAKQKYNDSQKSTDSVNSDKLVLAKVDLEAAQISLNVDKANYNEECGNLPEYKTQLINAETNLKNAKIELDSAKANLRAAQGKSSEIMQSASKKVTSMQENYDKAKQDAKVAVDRTGSAKLCHTWDAYMVSQAAFDEASDKLEDIVASIGGDMISAQQALDSAQISYDKSVSAYESTKRSVNSQLDTYKEAMEKDKKIIANQPQILELDKLKKDMAECTITAPISGTVTDISAEEGSVPNGVIFMVEDTETLKITTEVNEYDIANIDVGMKVVIKTDSTGDKEFEGHVSKVAPAAVKNSQETKFKIEVVVDTKDEKILIGMKARISIVAEEKTDTFFVNYDALAENKDGDNVIYQAVANKNGVYTAKEIPVKVGIESDTQVEISADGLKEGMKIITNIDNIKSGSVVIIEK
ncbi:MAG: efflux RND transporter periplasmic adaptor subunit, partial [Oscillospiraceae bacterium]